MKINTEKKTVLVCNIFDVTSHTAAKQLPQLNTERCAFPSVFSPPYIRPFCNFIEVAFFSASFP